MPNVASHLRQQIWLYTNPRPKNNGFHVFSMFFQIKGLLGYGWGGNPQLPPLYFLQTHMHLTSHLSNEVHVCRNCDDQQLLYSKPLRMICGELVRAKDHLLEPSPTTLRFTWRPKPCRPSECNLEIWPGKSLVTMSCRETRNSGTSFIRDLILFIFYMNFLLLCSKFICFAGECQQV